MEESIKNRNEAYKEIKPKLGPRQETVYTLIYTYGGLTIREVAKKMVLPPGSVSARVKDLEEMTLIRGLESRKDEITGKKGTIWVTIPEGERKAVREAKIKDLHEKAVHLAVDLGNVASNSAIDLISKEIRRVDRKLEILIKK